MAWPQIVSWLVEELALSPVGVATWRAGIARGTACPSLLIGDIDDLHENPLGIAALTAHGWVEPVPLIVLSRRTDVEEIAVAFGAVEGLRKPIKVGRLLTVVRGIPADEVH